MRYHRGFEKFQYILGNLEAHVHAQGSTHGRSCVYGQEKPENAIIFNHGALHKQEVRVKAELSDAWLRA